MCVYVYACVERQGVQVQSAGLVRACAGVDGHTWQSQGVWGQPHSCRGNGGSVLLCENACVRWGGCRCCMCWCAVSLPVMFRKVDREVRHFLAGRLQCTLQLCLGCLNAFLACVRLTALLVAGGWRVQQTGRPLGCISCCSWHLLAPEGRVAGTHTWPCMCGALVCRGAAEARAMGSVCWHGPLAVGCSCPSLVCVHCRAVPGASCSCSPEAHRGASMHSTSTVLGSTGGAVSPATTKCVACRVWSPGAAGMCIICVDNIAWRAVA